MTKQTLVYMEETTKETLKEVAHKTGKPMSKIVDEALEEYFKKYIGAPKTFEEALKRITGLGKHYKIENVREKMNKNMMERIG